MVKLGAFRAANLITTHLCCACFVFFCVVPRARAHRKTGRTYVSSFSAPLRLEGPRPRVKTLCGPTRQHRITPPPRTPFGIRGKKQLGMRARDHWMSARLPGNARAAPAKLFSSQIRFSFSSARCGVSGLFFFVCVCVLFCCCVFL